MKTSIIDDAAPVCSMFGLHPRQHDASFPRVFDCFLASNEIDMLEIRLRELEQGKHAASITSCKTSAITFGYNSDSLPCHSIGTGKCCQASNRNRLGGEYQS